MSRPIRNPLTVERLRQLLHYDPETGVFTRLVTTSYRAKAGDVAGMKRDDGHLLISVESYQYRANRLAVFYMTGAWPKGEVDHRDGNTGNNSWMNLRDVTPQVNQQNKRHAQSNSKTGLLGVSWSERDQCYYARIKDATGKYRSLGVFADPHVGHDAYLSAKRALHAGCTI